MPDPTQEPREDSSFRAQIAQEIEAAKGFAKTLRSDQVESGQWFVELLRKVVQAYDRNARATYFQQKYPGLARDEIADILTSVTVRYAAVAGAIAGAAATANQLAILGSAGMTVALFVGTIGAEMIYLARIQMRLVLDLSVVYDLQLDPDDPEDILMIFGYALGVTPTELLGKGLQIAAGATTKGAIRKYISKGTLKAIQEFARRLGFKILQRTIIKYAVPLASAAVGSSYNYVTTQSVGRIAKAHFKNRGKVTEELRELISRQNTYDLAFPAAVMYVAQVDGEFSSQEQELYRAMLMRMSFDEHEQSEFQRLVSSEDSVLGALSQIEDSELKRSLMDILVLMAVYDGELAQEECQFLAKAAEQLNVDVDMDEIAAKAQDYRMVVKESIVRRSADAVRQATSSAAGAVGRTATGAAGAIGQAAANTGSFVSHASKGAVGASGQAAEKIRDTATKAGSKVKGTLGQVFRGKKATCPNCGRKVQHGFQFCPDCGQAVVTEKHCVSCDEVLEPGFTFCPYCGAVQP